MAFVDTPPSSPNKKDKKPSLLRRTSSKIAKMGRKVGRTLTDPRQEAWEQKTKKTLREDAKRLNERDRLLAKNQPQGLKAAEPSLPPVYNPDNLPITDAQIKQELKRKFSLPPYAPPAFCDFEVPWWIRTLKKNVFDTLGIFPRDARRGQAVLDKAVNKALLHANHIPVAQGVPKAWEIVLAYRWLSARRKNISAALSGIPRDQPPSWNTSRHPGEAVNTNVPAVKLNLPQPRVLDEGWIPVRSHSAGSLRRVADFGAICIGEWDQRGSSYAVEAHISPNDELIIQVKEPDIELNGKTPLLEFHGHRKVVISTNGHLLLNGPGSLDISPLFKKPNDKIPDVKYMKEQVKRLRNHFLY